MPTPADAILIRSPDPPGRRRRPRPRGLRRTATAAFYGVSLATLDRLNAGGAIPAAVRLGGTLVWNRAELEAHLDHGGPPRREWVAIWAEVVRQRRIRG